MTPEYLKQQIVTCLEEIAAKHSIAVVTAEDLSANVPDSALINSRVVVMNSNLDTSVDYTYRLAHELSHILYGDRDMQIVYQFSEYGKRGEELLAHKNAIEMLMGIKMPASPLNFIDFYNIPAWLEFEVFSIFNKLSVSD